MLEFNPDWKNRDPNEILFHINFLSLPVYLLSKLYAYIYKNVSVSPVDRHKDFTGAASPRLPGFPHHFQLSDPSEWNFTSWLPHRSNSNSNRISIVTRSLQSDWHTLSHRTVQKWCQVHFNVVVYLIILQFLRQFVLKWRNIHAKLMSANSWFVRNMMKYTPTVCCIKECTLQYTLHSKVFPWFLG